MDTRYHDINNLDSNHLIYADTEYLDINDLDKVGRFGLAWGANVHQFIKLVDREISISLIIRYLGS